jgi:NADPH-dependent glutamate synthase beta subunit-like oxidoreductase
MHLVKEGETDKARELLAWEDPLPAILGRVCPAFCTAECNRGQYDEVVGIRDIERRLGDEFVNSPSPIPKRDKTNKGVGIVGSGPAGLSAAYFLTLLGHDVTIFEREKVAGGIPRLSIPDYRLPVGVVERTVEAIKKMGVKLRLGEEAVAEIRKNFDALFVSPGAAVSTALGIDGEDLPGVRSGVELLKEAKAGKIKEIKGKVAVIGGGNTALDAARTILRLGGEPVIIYRRTIDEMPAFADEVKEAVEEKIPMEFLKSPVKVSSVDVEKLSVTLIDMELKEPDESGRKRPVPVKGSEHTVELDGLVTAVGESVDLSFLGDIGGNEKVFFGGDAAGGARTVAHAAASGKRGAIAIDLSLTGKKLNLSDEDSVGFEAYFNGTPDNEAEPVTFDEINTDYFKKSERKRPERLTPEVRTVDFSEIESTLTPADSAQEASRCFVCGTCIDCKMCETFCPDFTVRAVKAAGPLGFGVEINYTYCKGCGICVRECPRGMFTMVDEETIEKLRR